MDLNEVAQGIAGPLIQSATTPSPHKECQSLAGVSSSLSAQLLTYLGDPIARAYLFHELHAILGSLKPRPLDLKVSTSSFFSCNQRIEEGGIVLWAGPFPDEGQPTPWRSGTFFGLDNRGFRRHRIRTAIGLTEAEETFFLTDLTMRLLQAAQALAVAATEATLKFNKAFHDLSEPRRYQLSAAINRRLPPPYPPLDSHRSVALLVSNAAAAGYDMGSAITRPVEYLMEPIRTEPAAVLRDFALQLGQVLHTWVLKLEELKTPAHKALGAHLFKQLDQNRWSEGFDPYLNLVLVVAILQLHNKELEDLLHHMR